MKKIFLFITIVAIVKPMFAQLPDFTLADCKGVEHHLYGDLQAGNAVVLDFSAVWCGPCAQAEPSMVQLYNDLLQGQCKVKQYLMLFDGLTPGAGSDCTTGYSYAKKFNINFPVITGTGTSASSLTGQFFALYDQINNVGPSENGIPMFLIILPNVNDPAQSTVKTIVGAYPDLEQMIKDSLGLAGFDPTIKVSGDLCSQPFHAMLTSGFDVSIWSTGETTQSIDITQGGLYTVAKDGCVASKDVEFTIAGTAHISTNTVCENGLYTLSYDIPQGTGGTLTWQYLDANNNWQDAGPADAGALTLNAVDVAGTVYTFRVKATNSIATDVAPCTQYSNEVQITIVNGSGTTSQAITASASVSQGCNNQNYTLTYTGGIPNSIWEVYNSEFDFWVPLEYFLDPSDFSSAVNGSFATAQPVTVNNFNSWSTVNGQAANKFRVKSPDGSCYILSNEVVVMTLPSPNVTIVGPNAVCEGSSSITLQTNQVYPSILWSTGATTPSIIVTPTPPTTYSVWVTAANGCTGSATKDIIGYAPKAIPKINASITSEICSGSPVTLSFGGTYSISPCTNAPAGQYPATAVDVDMDNFNGTTIADQAYTDQYSLVNVIAGKYYYFFVSSEIFGCNVTITSADGSQPLATGTSLALYVPLQSGQVRFYADKLDCSNDHLNSISKIVYGLSDLTYVGSLQWSTGQTTPSITVNPSVTTSYTLTFSDYFFQCPYSSTKQITIGIGAATETTDLISSSSARLNWTSSFNPDQWQLQYKGIAPGDKWVDVPLLAGTARSYSILSGLKAAQSYNWHIRAKCGKSWTLYSDAVTFKTLAKTGAITTRATDANNQLQPAEGLRIEVSPNPAANSFNVVVNSDDMSSIVVVQVFDALGRLVDTRKTSANSTIKIGEMYQPGSYYIRTVQGERHKEITVIKTGN